MSSCFWFTPGIQLQWWRSDCRASMIKILKGLSCSLQQEYERVAFRSHFMFRRCWWFLEILDFCCPLWCVRVLDRVSCYYILHLGHRRCLLGISRLGWWCLRVWRHIILLTSSLAGPMHSTSATVWAYDSSLNCGKREGSHGHIICQIQCKAGWADIQAVVWLCGFRYTNYYQCNDVFWIILS